ncbi:PDZ domain-containing protein, partial [Streptococcus danieliae]|nr:PDZ domain-containing protein [Streptococcus danieliae]
MKTNKHLKKLWLVPLVLVGLLIVSFWIPLPYYIEVPGGSEDISSVLRVNKKEDQADGEYQFVTIGVIRANLPLMIYAGLTPYTDIIPAADLTGGASDEEYQRINQFYMQTSQNFAKYQGLTKAKKEIEMKFLGVYVLSLAEDSTFKDILHLGDTVTGVNGKTFKNSQELIEYVGNLKIGDDVSVE